MEVHSHFHRQMREIKDDLLGMAGLVEAAIQDAYESLIHRKGTLAQSVIDGDRRIDLLENEIDDKAITLLATQQPVAVDLRFLSAAIKICSFLERMGDQAVNLAWRSLTLNEMDPMEISERLGQLYDIAREMVHDSLNAFAKGNPEEARKVIARDDEADKLTRFFLEDNIRWMNRESRVIPRGVELILASRHLERIADGATNIAEETVFQVEGEIIRHQGSVTK
jgi:phosphate transport system protein